jgi:hypothetical protein
MYRQEADNYFTLLLQTCQQNGFQGNPRKIFNMDEHGLQINGEPGKAAAATGRGHVHRVTSGQNGGTITDCLP